MRLRRVAGDLADLVERSSDAQRQLLALGVAERAVETAGLDDPRANAVLTVLAGAGVPNTNQQRAIGELVEQLDANQWGIQDEVDSGRATTEEHGIAFRLARAASSVAFAANEDPRTAASEATYEAWAAGCSIDELRAIFDAQTRTPKR